MCTWITERTEVSGSGKGPGGWFPLTHANVYFDHPYHAPFDHTLNIDFVNEVAGPGARVAVELTAESARALVGRIEAALAPGDSRHPSGSLVNEVRSIEVSSQRRGKQGSPPSPCGLLGTPRPGV